jgi:hypothetical protein
VLEPFLLRINEVSAELVYLSYILKSEIKTLKADSQSLTAKRCDDLLTRIKDKLHFRKHFGETGYFVGAISIKMEKRTLELKSLK